MDPTRSVARQLGVAARRVWVGSDAVSRLVAAGVGAGDHVLLAEPTRDDITTAVAASGARYVDCGRDHTFRVDPGGWRLGLAAPRTKLAWLNTPDAPTSRVADPERIVEGLRAGVPIVCDERLSWTPFAPVREGVTTLRRLGAHVVIGPEAAIARMPEARLDPSARAALMAALADPEAHEGRLAESARKARALYDAAIAMGLRCEPPAGSAVWVRVPGVPSAEIARLAGCPDVRGSEHWTWRDAVEVASLAGVAAVAGLRTGPPSG